MGKKFFIKALVVLMVFSLLITPALSQSYSRSITAWFNNLKVEVNGKTVNFNNEPFIYNNEVYLPIRELSDYTFIDYQLNDSTKTISLKTNYNNTLENNDNILKNKTFVSEIKELRNNLQSIASLNPVEQSNTGQNNFEIVSLRKQIAELEREIDILQEARFPYKKIKTAPEMETYLKEHFKKLGDIPMTLRFRYMGGNKYILSAIFNSSDLLKWNNLNRRDIENWVDDIFYITRDLLNPHAEIEGDIREGTFNYGVKHVSYWTRGSYLFFDFKKSENKKNSIVDGIAIENTLNSKLKNYNNASFTYEVFVHQNDIDLIVSYNQNFDSWSPSLKIQYLNRLKSEVDKLYDHVNINGRIVTGNNKETKLRFSFVDDQLRSIDLLMDLEKHLNQNYKNYNHNGNTFSFTYKIYEGYSGSFQVMMEGNFASDSTAWRGVVHNGELSFSYFIRNAFYYINSNWDVDIFGTVVDKSLVPIADLEFFRINPYEARTLQPIMFQ